MDNLSNDLLSLYSKIDASVKTHYKTHKKQPPCARGCASCCSQFFEISDLEFSLIEECLSTLSPQKQLLIKEKAETLYSLFKEHWPEFHQSYFTRDKMTLHNEAYYEHPDRYNVVLPCVFLSSEGVCEVYDRRPIVCRTTGVGFQYLYNKGPICEVMRHSFFTPLWQADLRQYKAEIEIYRWLEDDKVTLGFKRQYPMFFHVYKGNL